MPNYQDNKQAKINKVYTPSDKEQFYRKHVYDRKTDMEDAEERVRALKIWDNAEKQWEQYRAEKDRDDWSSNYYVPLTTAVVESAISEMVDLMPAPFVMPRGAEDIWKARIMEEIFKYSWEISNGDEEMKQIIRGTVIHGTAIGQEYYLKDARTIKTISGLSEIKNRRKQRQFEGEEKEVLEYDDVMLEWVSPWDFLIDENAREINRGPYKARDCIRRYIMSYDDAKRFFKGNEIYDHLNNFRFVKPGGNTDYFQFFKPPQGMRKADDVEVLWYWSRTPEDTLCIVINDVVVRMGPNPYRHKQLPYGKVVDINRLGKFYGKGEPELLESIQEESNMLRRMIMDRNHLDIDKMFTGPQNTQLDEDDLIARPHGFIPGEDIKAIEYGDIPLSVERTIKSIGEDKISVTGIDERFQSVSRTPSTATEAAILKEATLKRIKMKLKNFEKGFLVDVGRMRVSNILQFYPQPKLERIVGDKKTEEFKRNVAELARKGLLETRGGQMYEKKYKSITLQGSEMIFDAKGNPTVRRAPGMSFFEALPEFFVPSSELGYDIRFEAGPSMPVSKPLMQSKMMEAFDRVAPFAQQGLTNYDPEKLVDELIVKPADLNPEELKRKEEMEDEGMEEGRIDMAIELASQENQAAMNGEPIPALGTPYAPEPHTRIHLEFLNSEPGKQMPEANLAKFVQHITGEIKAIKQREGGAGGQPAQGGQIASPATGGGMGQGNQEVMPAMIQGGNQVPTGRVLGNG